MDSGVLSIITTILSAIGAGMGIVALYQMRATKRKIEAETGSTEADTRKTDAETRKTDAEANNLVSTTTIEVMKQVRLAYDLKIVDMQTDIDDLKSQILSFKTEVLSLKTEGFSLKTEVSNLKTTVFSLKSEVSDLKITIRKMGYMITVLINQILKLGKKPAVTPSDLDKYTEDEWEKMASND